MDENKDKTNEQAENTVNDIETFTTLIIDNVKYKTRLNKKFLKRKPYVQHNPKLIHSFIPGTICNVFIKKGSRVKAGEKLLELEAMKMVNTIFAEFNSVIEEVHVKKGEIVTKGQLLLKFK